MLIKRRSCHIAKLIFYFPGVRELDWAGRGLNRPVYGNYSALWVYSAFPFPLYDTLNRFFSC